MGAITRLTVELPDELARAVREQVASGQYASASEVIQEGLRALKERDEPMLDDATERWLRSEAVKVCEAIDAGRSEGVSIDEARARLAEARERRKSAG